MKPKNHAGQSLTEAVILAPFFLAAVFLLVQVSHIGLAVGIVTYATASTARHMVQNDQDQPNEPRFRDLTKMVGIVAPKILATDANDGSSGVVRTLKVTGCAEIPAYPFLGEILGSAMGSTGSQGEGGCPAAFVSIKGPAPYKFVIRSQTTIRSNYRPHG